MGGGGGAQAAQARVSSSPGASCPGQGILPPHPSLSKKKIGNKKIRVCQVSKGGGQAAQARVSSPPGASCPGQGILPPPQPI